MVRPLTLVNSKLNAREIERIVLVQSGQSAGQGTTMALAIGGPHGPLMVHVGGTGKIWSVHKAVPYPVSSVQMVSRSGAPSVPGCPPLGLALVTQVKAISNAVMTQM